MPPLVPPRPCLGVGDVATAWPSQGEAAAAWPPHSNGMAENEEAVEQEAEERSAPTGAVVYHAICSEGESELERPSSALAWSALAAGMSMSMSFVAQALVHASLPETIWRPLIVAAAYPVGFIIVILGRQQLFTENTLTVILPLLSRRNGHTLVNVARLWAIVLAANVTGVLLAAWVLARTNVVMDDVFTSMKVLAHEGHAVPKATVFLRGIFAGWLIALTVWLLPYAETARVWVIGLLTYVVGLAHFSHVIAGAAEAGFLVIIGDSTWLEFLLGFLLPALAGNIVGGVLLVALLNHAQVVAGGEGSDT
ncbi:MAG TPA: formate/nitrite transporter family protein [Thermoanaerobaculia bacterium]|nr:formate/nitrite transporter family protein [Thermoanaerobaculia bacterium]